MEKPKWNREKRATWGSGRAILLFLVIFSLLGGATWLFFIKGLYLLPDKMCDGVLKRNMVTHVLPQARSADDGSDSHGAGDSLTFSCYVTTSNDSSLSGQARVQPASSADWLKYYKGSGEQQQIIRVSVGDIKALAQIDSSEATSSVYVPCAPPGVPGYNASKPYAVVGEARIDGSTRATGVSLRQTLTDFAYQLTQHAYKLAECKAPRDFPEELPRYKDR